MGKKRREERGDPEVGKKHKIPISHYLPYKNSSTVVNFYKQAQDTVANCIEVLNPWEC